MKRFLTGIATLVVLFSFQATFGQEKIKTAVYWTCPWMINQADSIARHDLAIVDLENMINNREELVKIKKINPKIKLICYSNPMEIFLKVSDRRPLQNAWTKELNSKYEKWLLRTGRGKKAIFYEGMRMLNLSSACPKISGRTYGDWMSNLLLTKVLSDPIWDGFFFDNGGGNISYIYKGKDQLDADGDGEPDIDSVLDRRWAEGTHSFLKKIREAKGKNFIIIANKGTVEFMDILNGRMFENFPNDYLGDWTDGGWHQSMLNAAKTGPFTIFQVKEKDLNFGLASALLLDNVYICVGQNNPKFYPQYRLRLGKEEKRYTRNFENARIEVNPAARTGKIFIELK